MPRLAFAQSFWDGYDTFESRSGPGWFRAVSVLGVGEGAVPFAREITPREADPLQYDADLLRERCLLFVACTRAREALSVTWSGTPSPFLPTEAA